MYNKLYNPSVFCTFIISYLARLDNILGEILSHYRGYLEFFLNKFDKHIFSLEMKVAYGNYNQILYLKKNDAAISIKFSLSSFKYLKINSVSKCLI